MGEFRVSQTIEVPIYRVWERLADIGAIAEWNPGVTKSYTTHHGKATTGVGASRHCDLGGSHFLDEDVVTFEKQQAITFRIVKSNMPFKSADIRFTLVPHEQDPSATQVTCSPIYKLKYGPVGELLDTLMVRKQYRTGMKNLLAGLKNDLESRQ